MSDHDEMNTRLLAASKVEPFGEWCVVLPFVASSVSDAGLHLVTASSEMPAKAEVVGVGPDVRHIEPGMTVLMKKYQGLLYDVDGEEVMLIHQGAIIGQVIDYTEGEDELPSEP